MLLGVLRVDVVAEQLDDGADARFEFPDQFGVFALFAEEDAHVLLGAGELAGEVGDAGSWGGGKKSECWCEDDRWSLGWGSLPLIP